MGVTTVSEPVQYPHYLSSDQARRAECFRLAMVFTAGRSVPIQVVERIAHWIATGTDTYGPQ